MAITTIVQNVNDRKTSVVLGDMEKVLYGKGFILDELCGKTYAISHAAFIRSIIPRPKCCTALRWTRRISPAKKWCWMPTAASEPSA